MRQITQITSCGLHARSDLDDSREIFQKLALEAMSEARFPVVCAANPSSAVVELGSQKR